MKQITLFILSVMFSVSFLFAENNAVTDIKIGVLAKRGVDKALTKWSPTAEYLNSYYPQYNFKIIPMGFDEIPLLVNNSLVDFVIVNSGIYVDLSVKYNIQRIATLKNHLKTDIDVTRFGSVIFVKKDSSIRFLKDIKNKRVAAVHRTSFGGWIMAKRELRDQDIIESDFKKLDFLNTHDNVVFNVLNEEYDVGIVRTDTLERMSNENKIDINDLRVINKHKYINFPFHTSSRLYPEWPIAKLSDTDSIVAKKVAIALMQMKADSTAAKSSKIKGWTIPEEYNSVHDILKILNISPYEEYGKISFKSVLIQYWQWIVLFFLALGGLVSVALYTLRLNKSLKKEQHKLIENEERFRATFDQAGIGIIHMTYDGDFIQINQQFCQIINNSCIEAKKLNFSDFIHPADLATIMKAIEELKNSIHKKDELQIRLKSSSNETIWVVITLSKIVEDIENKSYIVATIVDISEIIKLEEKINHERLQKDIILNFAGDGILGLDLEAKHTFVNLAAAKLLGHEVDEMIGKDSHKMWHHSYENGENFPSSECPITSVLTDGITHRGYNETFWKNDKSKLKVDFISTPIKEGGEIVGTVVIFRESKPTQNTIEKV